MLDWMQGQWRDCADREAQLNIFRDMTGETYTAILTALGEDPAQFPKFTTRKVYRKWTPEEDERLLQMRRDDVDCERIAELMGRGLQSIYSRLKKLRSTGAIPESEPVSEKPAAEKKEKKKAAGGWDKAAEEEILALLEYEERLIAELEAVRGQIAQRRERLAELLSIAGGGLRDDEK